MRPLRAVFALVGVGSLLAPGSVPAPLGLPARQDSSRCTDPVFRQFDFWLGAWEVSGAGGARVGNSRITAILDGCALREEYEGIISGYRGTSYSSYERGRSRWHQTYVDNRGLLLQLDGHFDGKRMVLIGVRLEEKGDTVWDRTTWEALPGGRVRQLWEHGPGPDGPWKVIFDGLYRRNERPQ